MSHKTKASVGHMEKQLACFKKGTVVHTPEGRMAIDKLKVGDLVLSKPESGEGPLEPKRVVNTFELERKHIWKLDYVEIPVNQDLSKLTMLKIKQLSMKGKLKGCNATPNHPFYVKGEGWAALDQLKYGDLIPTSDPRVQVMVLQVTPVLLTTSSRRIVAAKSVVNLLEADKRGETIDDVDLYDLYECFDDGRIEVFGDQEYRDNFVLDGEHFELTDTVYYDTVYNIEVEDHHTYFVYSGGLWVHNTNCLVDSVDTVPKALQSRSGSNRPVGLDSKPPLTFTGLKQSDNNCLEASFAGGALHAYINNLYNQLSYLKAQGSSGVEVVHFFKTQQDLGCFKRFIEDVLADESFKLFEVKDGYKSVKNADGEDSKKWIGLELQAEHPDSAERLQFLRGLIFGVTNQAGEPITPPRYHAVFAAANPQNIDPSTESQTASSEADSDQVLDQLTLKQVQALVPFAKAYNSHAKVTRSAALSKSADLPQLGF